MRRFANQVEVGFRGDPVAILAIQIEGNRQLADRLGDIAGQRPVAGEVVMRNRRLWFDCDRFLESLDRKVNPVHPLVAPPQSEQGMEVFRVEPGRLLETVDRFLVAARQAVSLAFEEQDVRLEALRIGDFREAFNSAIRQTDAKIRVELPAVLKQRNQLEISLGLPDVLFSADAFDAGHVSFGWQGKSAGYEWGPLFRPGLPRFVLRRGSGWQLILAEVSGFNRFLVWPSFLFCSGEQNVVFRIERARY